MKSEPGSATSTLLLLGTVCGFLAFKIPLQGALALALSDTEPGMRCLDWFRTCWKNHGGKESVYVSPSVSGAGTTVEVMEVRRCLQAELPHSWDGLGVSQTHGMMSRGGRYMMLWDAAF